MKHALWLVLFSMFVAGNAPAWAQDSTDSMTPSTEGSVSEPEGPIWYENENQVKDAGLYADNTGPVGSVTGDAAVDIVNEDAAEEGSTGTLPGQITLKIRTNSDYVEVWTSDHMVEYLTKGDGSTGQVISQSGGEIKFQPAGRPILTCPKQSGLVNWFGPCVVDEDSASTAS